MAFDPLSCTLEVALSVFALGGAAAEPPSPLQVGRLWRVRRCKGTQSPRCASRQEVGDLLQPRIVQTLGDQGAIGFALELPYELIDPKEWPGTQDCPSSDDLGQSAA